MNQPEPHDPGPTGSGAETEIRAGIDAATRERRVIDHRTARLIAELLSDHLGGGPDANGPLQQLVQTGAVVFERNQSGIDIGGLLDEIASLLDWELPENGQQWLAVLASYAHSREAAPGPLPNW